jgi:hypothetical protein
VALFFTHYSFLGLNPKLLTDNTPIILIKIKHMRKSIISIAKPILNNMLFMEKIVGDSLPVTMKMGILRMRLIMI